VIEDEGAPAPPEGFVLSTGRGPFATHNGPYFHRAEPGAQVEQCFFVLPRHANGLGLVHGGMLSAFMDTLLAVAAHRATQQVGLTVHLSVDFLDMARVGEWVMGESKVTRVTRDLAFSEGRAHVGGRDIVRASGVFKLMRRRAG